MQTASQSNKPRVAADSPSTQPKTKKPRPVSWESFEKRYLSKEDGYTYEWSNGVVLKTRNSMGPSQSYIHRKLMLLFYRLFYSGKVEGQLLAEPNLFFNAETHKHPDFAWLTNPQIDRLSQKWGIEIPEFLIEVVSNNDVAQKLMDKLQVYRSAGVRVVWLIFPNQEEIHVFAGHNLEQMTVCFGDKICSAAPALLAFAFETKKVFAISVDGSSALVFKFNISVSTLLFQRLFSGQKCRNRNAKPNEKCSAHRPPSTVHRLPSRSLLLRAPTYPTPPSSYIHSVSPAPR